MQHHNALVVADFDPDLRPYLNLSIPSEVVRPYLDFLSRRLDVATFEANTAQQRRRDRDRHHLTVVSPIEFPKLDGCRLPALLGYPLSVTTLGVGQVTSGGNEVQFIVCESLEVQMIRRQLGLPPADLHITLAFTHSDVFNQPKDRRSLLQPYADIEAG